MGEKDKKWGETEKEVRKQNEASGVCSPIFFSTFSSITEAGPRLVVKIQIMSMYRSYLMLFNSQKVYIILHLTNNWQSFSLVFPQGRAATETWGLEISPG